MKKTYPFVAIVCMSLMIGSFITSCSKKIVYDKIMFGRGGGFTGKYDDYFLGKNGNVYKKDPSTKAFTKIKSLPGKQTKAIFKIIDDNKLFKLGFNNPYNMSSYIEIVKDSISNRIVWGNVKSPPPAAVTELFDKLMGLIPVQNMNNKPNSNKK